ncbi:hypothetical protein M407DRAFT_17498 [Tulasnella calospora MUT 4182]|uniref:Uncharacterized protein n=1 Tax=Tulasnella calospora MUT 4182 TaxID=1051891 RepID=A0A0C3QX30_9AGAM|nr:hypothetical protein M407DRAFT_17498 [Tulasnella calospora MUT 4182]
MESFDRLALERLADETAAQVFGVGFNDLHSFITQKCESREESDIVKPLDALLRRLFQHRNRLLRLHLLPDEILLHIFKLGVDFDRTTDITKNKTIQFELKVYYQSFYPFQRVCKRWHDIIVSYAPFWSLIGAEMPKDMIELALARAQKSTLFVGTQYAGPDKLRQFTDRVLPLSDRIGSLTMDHKYGGSDITAPFWMALPNIQNLQLTDVDDPPYVEGFDESSNTMKLPSPRWIHLCNSTLPTAPTLYSQVEELVLESPFEALTMSYIKLLVESAPRLRILRLDEIGDHDPDDVGSLDNLSSLAPQPMPNLRLLHISQTNTDVVAWLLNLFQLSPYTSIQINCCSVTDVLSFQSQIRDRIWAALHFMTDSSFALELAPWVYRFQTRNMAIEIEISNPGGYAGWPDFFKDFVPRAGQGPIRVYIFLKCSSNASMELPKPDCIKGLQSDSFAVIG